MIEASRNYYINVRGSNESQEEMDIPFSCDYCLSMGNSLNRKYHYCEKCSMIFCLACEQRQANTASALKKMEGKVHCGVLTNELELKSEGEVNAKLAATKQQLMLVFHMPKSTPSTMLKDFITLQYHYY